MKSGGDFAGSYVGIRTACSLILDKLEVWQKRKDREEKGSQPNHLHKDNDEFLEIDE